MSWYDLMIRGATLVSRAGLLTADLAVADGRIVALAPDLTGSAAEEIDAAGLHIFPGVIDAHVHFDEPGRADWEGFVSGSRAFAAGGGTTFFDMPLNAHPPTVDAASFDLKRAAAEAGALVDFALWGGLVPGNLDRLDELAARGVVGFKAFMSRTGTDDFPAADDLTLYLGMERAARLGLPVAVHCENDQVTAGLARRALAEGRADVRAYLASRPAVAEIEAIGRAIALAEATGCTLHIVHVSTGRGVALVTAARARGADVSCETCAHYLTFTEDDVERIGAVAKCAPPIRSAADREALWTLLRDGALPIVTSDHSPCPPSMKAGADFFTVWGGIAGCQSTLAALLTEGWDVRGVPLPLLAAVLAGNVAGRFQLSGKGILAVGADADLALVDLDAAGVLTAADLHYRHKLSPYLGRRLRGRVVRTLLRGRTMVRDGQPLHHSGGQLVRPLGTSTAGSAMPPSADGRKAEGPATTADARAAPSSAKGAEAP
jgi:allantoinase